MRRPIIAGNWKMYKGVDEAIELANEIKRGTFDIENVEIVICPPFVDLGDVGEMLVETNIALGAQNCFWEKEGAFTGEISASMLKSVGCRYVIIGHSERRKYFGETDETVSRRIKAALEAGLSPIMCVGESLNERESGKTLGVVKEQVTNGLKGFKEESLDKLVIAYEPVWAIGTGKTATPLEAEEVHRMIRVLLCEIFSEHFANSKQILYGGSVKPDNIHELMSETDIDGALVGGASLKSDGFLSMIKTTSQLYTEMKGVK